MPTREHTYRGHAHSVAGQTRRLRPLGQVAEVRLTADDTAGGHALFEVHSPPGSGVPELHTHPPSETFYVLEGEYEVYLAGPAGAQAIRLTAGDAVHIPAGAPHGYKNVGARPARMLALFERQGGCTTSSRRCTPTSRRRTASSRYSPSTTWPCCRRARSTRRSTPCSKGERRTMSLRQITLTGALTAAAAAPLAPPAAAPDADTAARAAAGDGPTVVTARRGSPRDGALPRRPGRPAGYMAAGPNEDSPLRAMGRHYLNPRLAGDTRVEARRPVLVYERRGGRLRLTGVEY